MSKSDWINSPENIEDYQGFVYILEYNGLKYIGKKNFWKVVRYPPLKGKKRVRLKQKETDWATYFGSSERFLEHIKGDEDKVKRTIIRLCKTKWEMSYYELKEQLDKDVLYDDSYMNNIINVRLSGNGRC